MVVKKKNNVGKYLNQISNLRKQQKTYRGEWWTINSLMGIDWAMFLLLLGGREAGKSYSAMRWGVTNKLKHRDNFKFYWFRLTEQACKALLEDNATKFIDPDLQRKFNVKTHTKGSRVYTHREVVDKKTGKVTKADVREFCDILACSTFYNSKGVGYFDNEFKGTYYIVLDEMNREQSEANRFDIVYNFVNLVENVARSTKVNIKVVMIGNTLDEASDLLAAFNFLPETFGRYKLKRKRAVVEYIKPNEEYIKRRKGTVADILQPNASTFTNEVKIDRTMLTSERLTSPNYIIKFTKSPEQWFTVWNGNVVKQWNKETCRAIPMRRYLDEKYDPEEVKEVYERFDGRSYRYRNLADFKRFEKQLRLLKK